MANSTNLVERQDAPVETTRATLPGTKRVSPPVDVFENDDEYFILVDMPGVKPEAVQIQLEASELTVQATQEAAADAPWVPLEFYRSVALSRSLAPDRIGAELKAGVLQLRLGKSEQAKPKHIQITSG